MIFGHVRETGFKQHNFDLPGVKAWFELAIYMRLQYFMRIFRRVNPVNLLMIATKLATDQTI